MASFTVYKLHFTSPVHFGDNRSDYGISLKTLQSDTLYAAVTSCLAKLGVDIPSDGDLGCAISSAFPFYQEKKDSDAIYFFPKPLRFSLPKLANITDAKKVKKVAWLDLDYFRKVVNGTELFAGGNADDITAIKDKIFLTRRPLPDKFIASQVSPRVTVSSRLGDKDAVPFYMDRVYFKDYSGLYFIACGNCSLLEKGLSLLQYEGIGTDRNVGNGYFEYDEDTIELQLPQDCEYSLSLSMFIPESKAMLEGMLGGNEVSYDFTRRGGWITDSPYNTVRKNVIHAFLPASVFAADTDDVCVKGKIVDLKPAELDDIARTKGLKGEIHPVWRSGKSIFIPIKL